MISTINTTDINGAQQSMPPTSTYINGLVLLINLIPTYMIEFNENVAILPVLKY